MQVKLTSITSSLIEDKPMSAEELLVYIARVSNPSNQLNTETSDKLIGYMIKNKHWSPFDMINMTVGVETSRAIAHQILRHWSIKPQEFSQRYAESVYFEDIDFRVKAEKNRQSSEESVGSIRVTVNNEFIPFYKKETEKCDQSDLNKMDLIYRASEHLEALAQIYKDMIKEGIAKESARMILPLTTSTTMYLNGSVRSWIHYMEQRCDKHAQLEHRQVANEVRKIFIENFPMTSKALNLK